MLMAGVVKIQANCPTWLNLTALDYHFATQVSILCWFHVLLEARTSAVALIGFGTQCLPNPLAWYAHQLPPAVQSWSVAATLLIEIPLTILLLVPIQVSIVWLVSP
jgi:hypothetical protein